MRVVSASFHDSDGLGGELNHWLWRNSISLLGRLMIWRRRKPTVRHDALLLDAELQIMLSELRYPSIYKPGASSPGDPCQHQASGWETYGPERHAVRTIPLHRAAPLRSSSRRHRVLQ